MSPIWQSLLANLALVSSLLVAWDLASDLTDRLPQRTQSLLLGVILCFGTLVSMASAQQFVTGFFFDLRSPLVAAAAFFGGWPAALIAAAGAIAYRLHLGGLGTASGVMGIFLAAALGLAWHNIAENRGRTLATIFGLGLSLALASLINLFTVTAEIRASLIEKSTVPVFFLTLLSTVIIGVLLDRQIRRRELSTANMIYSAMVRELPDCLNMKDLDGRFLAANPATASLMRAGSVENLIGKTDFDFYPRDLADQFRKDELAALQSGFTLRIDQPATFPDGREGWLSTAKTPFRDQSGRVAGLITYNRDVTDQKRSAQLKDEFISTVSHELRTPLTSIRGSLGLISAGVTGELPPKAANLIKIAHANSERLVHLINDILDIEKIESGKMSFQISRMPVRPLVEQAIAASSNYMSDKNVRIVLVDDAPRAEANVDPDRLHQVLANLLSNAIKFSPADETVAVRFERRPKDMLRISVSDRGEGIPEAFRDRIFGKFEQADASSTRAKGGTGLGLSIVKMIAEKFGGSVSFDSEEGKGTTFHVDLPEARAEKARTHEVNGVAALDDRMRVLICEDEADISAVIAALLDAEGFSSDVAPDIASAKALLKARSYAALTLDIKLAGESGITLFRDVRASSLNSDVPVIVISAVADEARRSLNGSAVGIIDWLEKPIEPERLHAALGKIVNSKVDRRPKILHVEDDEGVLAVMSEGLGSDASVTFARTLQEARNAVTRDRFDLVILDIGLPDGSGLDLLSDLPHETAVMVFSAAEFDGQLGDQVKMVMTKTKASELDVARLVRAFLPAAQGGSATA
ncbi:ATP-binding protein [Mesorhizobium sp. SP-1A]|uniref:ATP-binding protein n=1 Tax=Mesorhizobium sp. SP-1A TaxID=3077840 RepID=UPI0028F6F806|nr:ATP-binding protein [Mesorhizobium sp. SP-1A]